ncbi:glycine betaine ABC transporter substrate-binding protein [Desulforamulus aeronauticus]|uniref:glycine betaine ABC transporter substrate-binding protein n=1 Tax=Desulforamulus aeronauticus TaxID=53343 RepID=UPI0009347E4F|nr:glycine betaine ABC transporter substrate-binding protein [Desulforamulus aeronauticus]
MKRRGVYLLLGALMFSLLLVGCGSEQSNTVKKQIIGIDPGAGLMKATGKAITEYQLKDWELVEGSGAAMTAALTKAYENKEPIIITGWTPHWKFSKYDLKYLEDPKKVFGEAEDINTIVRTDLKKDHPVAYALLDSFHWEPADMESVMVAIQEGKDPKVAAQEWVKNNEDKVDKWLTDLQPVSGEKITLAYVAWDSEIASTNVVAVALEKLGYQVELSQVEAGPMWAGIASGDADAMVAGWLPTTHADYYQEFQGKFEDLGANLEGTKIGLVVPSYMEISSIEDLNK